MTTLRDRPWETEPNKLQWVDPVTDLDCLIVRATHHGALCGYVGVPNGHPLYGVAFYDVNEHHDVDVHGGLSYSATCNEDDPEGVCHVPEPGRPGDVWWLGFDCTHAGDFVPSLDAILRDGEWDIKWMRDWPYRDVEYVRGECARLASQLATVGSV